MRKVSGILPPVIVEKHNIIFAPQLGKDTLSSSSEDTHAFGETSLLKGLLGEVRMKWVYFNCVHSTVWSPG